MEISQPLLELDWIPRPKITALRRLGMETVENVLTHYPRRYEDRHEFPHFPREESSQPICLCGEVTKTSLRRFGGWKKIFEATLEEANSNALSEPITLRWFNLHYVQKMIATGQRLVVFGKPRLRGKRICMEHPEFEVIEEDEEMSIHFRRITPIYPATEGVSQRLLRSIIYRVLSELSDAPLETLVPAELDRTQRRQAINQIHFPDSWQSLSEARNHLVLAEFFAMQMLIASRRNEAQTRSGGAHAGSGELLDKFLGALPFELTSAQKTVMAEVRRDLAASFPMNRLLQGDVGSGKTVVAIGAMLLAAESGYQAAFMAPTQILAEQHYSVLRGWLDPLGIRLSLRTGARQEESGPLPLFANANPASAREDDLGSAREDDLGSTGCQPVAPESLSGANPEDVRYSKRHLPHFERPWAKYAVTFSTRNRRVLKNEERDIVLDSILHWKDKRYELYATCVMPDHVHMLFEPSIKKETETGAVFFSLGEIFRSIKRNTAREINRLSATTGAVWEEESFDRMIRSERDLEEKFDYITRNPFDAAIDENGRYRWVWFPEIEHQSRSMRRVDYASRRATSPCSPDGSRETTAPLPSDAPHIIVGTHALLYEGVEFSNLGLVVIDEQHKFGVAQRARLTSREPAPDVLVMTATPIPRTLTMTVYGDLDVSIIDEMPKGRGKIITAVRETAKLGQVLMFLRKEIETGRQAYIVYPLIDESEKIDVKAAAKEFEQWQERLRPFQCEVLHGRIPADEKQKVMERFRKGQTQLLVSTTVIEVGVDVPNATIMLIENAERFGLAQLHQLRGRIGRGAHKSYCILLTNDCSPETTAKLAVLERTTNGFEVAEADWELRGPGDLLGTAQSGLPALRIGNLKSDAQLMQTARQAAVSIFRADPRLDQPENQRFRALIVEEQGRSFANVS